MEGAVIGPIVGIFIVALAYLTGIILSIKCCKPDYDQFGNSFVSPSHREARDPNVDIFIVSRSEDYVISIPRSTFQGSPLERSYSEGSIGPGPAPEYEEPPSYDDCVKTEEIV